MKFLNNTFAFVIPLTAMLISFTIFLFSSNILDNYKLTIANDYSIVVVTNTPLIKEDVTKLADIRVEKIITLEKNQIITNIKSNLSKSSINLLKRKLPYFYKIKLTLKLIVLKSHQIILKIFSSDPLEKLDILKMNRKAIQLVSLLKPVVRLSILKI